MAMKNWKPTHRILNLELKHNQNQIGANQYYEDFHYVDLSQILSTINSRLYRQGRVYRIKNIVVHDGNGDAFVKFATLPHTWPMQKAWQTALKHYLQMNDSVSEDALSTAARLGRYHDFRIYMTKDHITDPDTPQFMDVEQQNIVPSEFNYSTFTDQDGGGANQVVMYAMGGGSTATQQSCLQAFHELMTKAEDGTSDEAVVNWENGFYSNLIETSTGDDDILQNRSEDYDNPPYPVDTFPGLGQGDEPWTMRELHIASQFGPQAATGGFDVPLGLLLIETAMTSSTTEESPNIIGIQIELEEGTYKGVHAEPYGTPKRINAKTWRVD